jgi:hypothetical protein
MSFLKTSEAKLANPMVSMGDWSKMYGNHAFGFGQKRASLNKIAESSQYLLSHCCIMASVMVEDEPFDYLIKPETSHLCNNNDDSWSNEVLRMSHKTFVGAFNFLEHFQNSKHAKGHILDAQLRKVSISPPDIWVWFCDILVATEMVHEQLIGDIRSGKTKYMSMGCVTDLVICSFCGARVTDANTYCQHLNFQKGMFMPDEDGIPRRIAELCGHPSLPNGGVKFIEASWVETPAFPGAELRGIVSDENGNDTWTGPKTKFTHSIAAGYQKVASLQNSDSLILSTNGDDAALEANLHWRLRNA